MRVINVRLKEGFYSLTEDKRVVQLEEQPGVFIYGEPAVELFKKITNLEEINFEEEYTRYLNTPIGYRLISEGINNFYKKSLFKLGDIYELDNPVMLQLLNSGVFYEFFETVVISDFASVRESLMPFCYIDEEGIPQTKIISEDTWNQIKALLEEVKE